MRAIDKPALIRVETPYRPRHLRFIRREDLGEWRLKLYGIATNGNMPRPEFVEASTRLARDAFPQPAVTDQRHGTGFVIAHDAATACIALFYWWQSQNELHQRIYFGPKDDPNAMAQISDPAAGCVWEIGIIDFERRAWIEDVLANPNGPDVERYLERHFDADV
ncbi:MAG TPA: hypothetical protein VES61_05190 [Gaiellaceae bacterium]|nr:hypothetical protein [Gaiellaceae bacterium]